MNERDSKFVTLSIYLIAISLGLFLVANIARKSQPIEITATESREMLQALGGGGTQIIAFVTDWCPVCQYAERYLKQQQISYIRADIEKDRVSRKYFDDIASRTGSSGIPQIVVGTKVIVGFDQHGFEAARQALLKEAK